jgi:hypothetical protein
MTHFISEKSRDYTLNYISKKWLNTPTNLRTQFPPTLEEVELLIGAAIAERPAIAEAGYPVALLAERGYQLSVARRNGLPVPYDDRDTE